MNKTAQPQSFPQAPIRAGGWKDGVGQVCTPLATLFFLAVIGWFGHSTVEKAMKLQMAEQLQSTLNANVKALKIWIEENRSTADSWAIEPMVRQNVLSLARQVSGKDWTRKRLLATQELKRLRDILGPVCRRNHYIGFVVFDRTGLQIGSLLNGPVGRGISLKQFSFVEQSLSGKTVVSHPFPGKIPLPTSEGEWKKDWPTMFVSAPVRGDAGKIVAVLAFRLRPETEFTQILEVSRTGLTDETYAFDASGTMISDSRFNGHLKKIGLIANRPGSRAILNLQIRDPGGNMVLGFQPKLPREKQPLTRMAAQAVQGHSGTDVEGYNDYRGVPVVGSWTWLPEYGFGVTTEMDLEEAFVPLFLFRRSFFLLFALWTLTTIISLALRTKKRRLEKQRLKAREDLQTAYATLEAKVIQRTKALVLANRKLEKEIHERERAEDQIKKSLQEKEILIKEINHRTKNNLQLISSLLQLQAEGVKDHRYAELFRESHNRIKSMALIHEKIVKSQDLARIDLHDYFWSLANELLNSYGADRGKIALNVDAKGVILGLDAGIYCGLIINELVSNALKYAFLGNQQGLIHLGIRPVENNRIELLVRDNGVGIPKDLNLNSCPSLGLQLVTTLAEDQLEGSIQLNRKQGTEFKIIFPGEQEQ
ncbi:MAG: sensor histidine kinase [Nitrospinaceae bacterium]